MLALGKRQGTEILDLAGRSFGKLRAIAAIGRTPGRHVVWSCLCECGSVVAVSRTHLLGNKRSCGCEGAVAIGMKFGAITAVDRSGQRWLLRCECGGTAHYTTSQLTSGRRSSCGACAEVRRSRGVARCSKCETEKPLADFAPRADRPGCYSSRCRDCLNAGQAAVYRYDLDASRERRRQYAQSSTREYHSTPKSRAKHAAHADVSRAIKRGDLVRQLACENCDAEGRIEAHHDDYSRRLDVKWLCVMCHRARHKELAACGLDPDGTVTE
jgi:hypothetical protein